MLWTVKLNNVTVGIFILITSYRRASSLTNQSGAQTWEIHSVKLYTVYEYKTDFHLNGGKGFKNGTKQVFVQNKSWLQVPKHKGSNATVCLDKLACFMLEQMRKIIILVLYGEQEFSFSFFAACFKFPNLFLLLLLILKCFPKVFKAFLGCLIRNVYYNITATSISVGRSNHDIFYFFGEKSLNCVVKLQAAILNPVTVFNNNNNNVNKNNNDNNMNKNNRW